MAYFSTGTEGSILDEQCSDCPLGAGWNDPRQARLFAEDLTFRACPVNFVQLDYNYVQVDKGQEELRRAMNILINEDGECQVRKELVEILSETP